MASHGFRTKKRRAKPGVKTFRKRSLSQRINDSARQCALAHQEGIHLARALAASGAFVVVSGRNKARGDDVVAAIRSTGGGAAFVAADLGAGEHEIQRVAAAATDAAGWPKA